MYYVEKQKEIKKFNIYLPSQQVSLADTRKFFWHLPNANLKDTTAILCLKKALYRMQKQPSRGVLRKMCFENMQQIYKRTSILKFQSRFTRVA